jgi:putative transposase
VGGRLPCNRGTGWRCETSRRCRRGLTGMPVARQPASGWGRVGRRWGADWGKRSAVGDIGARLGGDASRIGDIGARLPCNREIRAGSAKTSRRTPRPAKFFCPSRRSFSFHEVEPQCAAASHPAFREPHMEHGFFDPHAATLFRRGRLPHWEQPGAFCFITFRLADSLPRDALATLVNERDRWLWSRTSGMSLTEWKARRAALGPTDRAAFQSHCTRLWQQGLDACHGECILREPAVRRHVTTALEGRDGSAYRLDAFVVMPNHVHVLAGLGVAGSLRREVRSWKQLSARRINTALGRRGTLWQMDCWDRLVRDETEYCRTRRYIERNPIKAGLRRGEYTLYVRHV